MKIKNLILIATLLITVASSKSTYANIRKDDSFTILEDAGTINSIEVHGNVQLFITDAPADVIKVYNKYYAENALIQNKNGVLRISSYKNEKLVVWVKAKDLRSVALFDNSQIRSFGRLSKIEFNVELHNSADAQLNLDAFNLNLLVKDNARADIKGTAEELYLNSVKEQSVTRDSLAAVHVFDTKSVAVSGRQITAL